MPDNYTALSTALADRYCLEREIGQGGMATVYLAEDLRHARRVAVKVLHPDLAAALGAERFLAEIKTTANLQHSHILALHDSGAAGGFLYYVMPFVEGESLRQRLERERQLPMDDALRFAREVADALGYAHARGVIHRDIKPENILLQGGHALVADFGIALAVQTAGGKRMTQTGLSLGTPQYMSPEQAMGERTIDARSDIYALGAVTYEMLTGDPPFTVERPGNCCKGHDGAAGRRPVRSGHDTRGGGRRRAHRPREAAGGPLRHGGGVRECPRRRVCAGRPTAPCDPQGFSRHDSVGARGSSLASSCRRGGNRGTLGLASPWA
jgi:serine/threonine protein kinase